MAHRNEPKTVVQFVRRVRNVEGPGTVQEVGHVAALPEALARRLVNVGQVVRVNPAALNAEPVEEPVEAPVEDAEEEPKPRRRRRKKP